nr:hypothetical protein [Propionicimonas sp.]
MKKNNNTTATAPAELEELAGRLAAEGWRVETFDGRGGILPPGRAPRRRLLVPRVLDAEGRALGCLVLDERGTVRVLGPWKARVSGPGPGPEVEA